MADLWDFLDARAAGDDAADACRDKAERLGWDSAAAAEFVLGYLRRHGPTPGEVLVDECSRHHPPHDGRAFGAVFGTLARRGVIVKAGAAARLKGHGTAGGIVWALAAAEQAAAMRERR